MPCCSLLLLLAVVAPRPETKKGPQPAKPPPEMQQLRFFEGEWRCEGKAQDAAVATRWSFKPDLNKFWLTARHVEQRSKNRPLPIETAGLWGYDGAGRQFMRMMVSNQGDWQTATSSGWTGEDFIWTGENNQVDGHKVPLRHIITSNGPREFTDRLELNAGGEWRLLLTTACKK